MHIEDDYQPGDEFDWDQNDLKLEALKELASLPEIRDEN